MRAFEKVLDVISPSTLPYGMFEREYGDREARRAKRLESIYHVGQERIWDGREVLAELLAKHGQPRLDPETKRALGRIFSIIMWGELAAWKISAQLADRLVPLEQKLAAASQVHDEARHFYVMHDYLDALGYDPGPMDLAARRVVELTLATDDLLHKILGMQLTIETIALTIFSQVRALRVEPVLTELLVYYERDEARHVGLGIQTVPAMIARLGPIPRARLFAFQLNLLLSTMGSLKAMEPDLEALGVSAREIIARGWKKQLEINEKIKAEFPETPDSNPAEQAMTVITELVFPEEGPTARIPTRVRLQRALGVLRGSYESVGVRDAARVRSSDFPPAASAQS